MLAADTAQSLSRFFFFAIFDIHNISLSDELDVALLIIRADLINRKLPFRNGKIGREDRVMQIHKCEKEI